MTPHKLLVLAVAALLIVASAGCRTGGSSDPTIVLYGFSAMEEVMKNEIIPGFQRHWRSKSGQDVRFVTSFAGSGTITNQIIFGAPAQVALVATEMDALSIKHAGFASTDWRTFTNQGTFAYSVTCIVTRHGNPKGIHSFELLRAADAEVVYPDPTTSGGAQWAILALYGSALRESELASGSPDLVHARRLLKDISLSAGSLPESARRALTQFGLGYGDALLTYENEALLDLSKGKDYEIVIPKTTIYIEPKVLIIDRNVGAVEREVVEALVDYLWTSDAQDSLARNNFRVWDEAAMARYSDKFVEVEYPFTVEYLGGWERATSDIIERTWREIQREIN